MVTESSLVGFQYGYVSGHSLWSQETLALYEGTGSQAGGKLPLYASPDTDQPIEFNQQREVGGTLTIMIWLRYNRA